MKRSLMNCKRKFILNLLHWAPSSCYVTLLYYWKVWGNRIVLPFVTSLTRKSKSLSIFCHRFLDRSIPSKLWNILQIHVSDRFLTRIKPMLHIYRNPSIDLQYKSIDWFLYECNIGLIWVNCWDLANICFICF